MRSVHQRSDYNYTMEYDMNLVKGSACYRMERQSPFLLEHCKAGYTRIEHSVTRYEPRWHFEEMAWESQVGCPGSAWTTLTKAILYHKPNVCSLYASLTAVQPQCRARIFND